MKNIAKIIIIILILVVIGVAAYLGTTAYLANTVSTQENAITESGSKVTIFNHNKDVWSHWDLIMENVTLKNGTTQNFYVEVWIKPEGNVTIDLSNLLGYGNEQLPTDTNITVLAWGGVFNTTASGNSLLNNTFTGWTTTPVLDTYLNGNKTFYKDHVDNITISANGTQPIGPLPASVTDNTVMIKVTPEDARSDPADGQDEYEQLFTEIHILVDPNGVPHFRLATIPELCTIIANINVGHII